MILDKLKKDLIEALKAKNTDKVLVLRYMISQIRNEEIELRAQDKTLTDEDALLVLKRQIKKRKKALEQFEKGNRQDIVAKEKAELEIVESYFNEFSS